MELLETLKQKGEYCALGAYENPERGLFFRKSVAIKRFYEKCPLPNYDAKPLYPSGEICRDTLIAPRYITGLATFWTKEFTEDETLMLEAFNQDFKQSWSSVPLEHTVAGNMWTHAIPHYERILKEGFSSYLPRIEKIQARISAMD